MRKVISNMVTSSGLLMFTTAYLLGFSNKIKVRREGNYFDFVKASESIRISRKQLPYLEEILHNFDFLFHSVKDSAVQVGEILQVDFSRPTEHILTGWSHFGVNFSAFPEPISTNEQYLEFLQLSPGEIVLDIGSYSGMSGLMFLRSMSNKGKVISIEPDPINRKCTELNFQKYRDLFGIAPELSESAIWSKNETLLFASDNNVGSSVAGINGRKSTMIQVQGKTLSQICADYSLSKVDAIKLDCEGAELEAFKDYEFFKNAKPRIIFEAVLRGKRKERYLKAISILESYGYSCSVIDQIGSTQKLVGAC